MATIQKRVSSDGEVTYRALVRLKGHPPETATFKRKTDASRWAQQTEVAIRERRFFKTSESKKRTLSDLIARYLARLERTNPKRVRDVKPMLDWWDKELGYCILADISRAVISEKIDVLSDKTVQRRNKETGALEDVPITTSRINRYLAALSHVFTIAVNEWEWLDSNPMLKIKKMSEPRGRIRYLDEGERKALLKVCKTSFYEHLYTIVILALSTGARKSEILNLKWQDINFDKGQIVLHETKNKERRVIPLSGLAYDLIKEMVHKRRNDTDLVFPSIKGDKPYEIKKSWESALEEAGIEDFRFHDLRHSAASYLAMNGASLAEIAEVLGHKTLSMVKRYAHLSEAHTRDVVSRMNKEIFDE